MADGRQRAANVIFVGADFEDFEVKNLYKSLNLVKPDIVLLQLRPDLVFDASKFKNYETSNLGAANEDAKE